MALTLAPEQLLEGTVEVVGGGPVPRAELLATGQRIGVIDDPSGRFRFPFPWRLCAGNCSLQLVSAGFPKLQLAFPYGRTDAIVKAPKLVLSKRSEVRRRLVGPGGLRRRDRAGSPAGPSAGAIPRTSS